MEVRNMTKKDVINEICNCFDYDYKIFDDGRIILDGNGEATIEWLNKNFCGHKEYQSVDEMLIDWLKELKNGKDAQEVFLQEIEFIETTIL